ncbi:MAG: hypothetical protein M1840_001972 [Geoglossum simile]|nr:MAG: hypothetical protein M1840_001972 [Geoglossum simile]
MACYPTHDAIEVPRILERELDKTLGNSIEDETETETESESETETETHTEKGNRLRCPHQECRHKKASNLDVVCDAKCVCGKGFTHLLLFKRHLKTCQTKKDGEKHSLNEKQIQIIELVHHLRDQASKQINQELEIRRGHKCKQELTACKEHAERGYREPMQEPGMNTGTGDEYELERERDEVDTLPPLFDKLGSTRTHLRRPRKRQHTDVDAPSASTLEDEMKFSDLQADSLQSMSTFKTSLFSVICSSSVEQQFNTGQNSSLENNHQRLGGGQALQGHNNLGPVTYLVVGPCSACENESDGSDFRHRVPDQGIYLTTLSGDPRNDPRISQNTHLVMVPEESRDGTGVLGSGASSPRSDTFDSSQLQQTRTAAKVTENAGNCKIPSMIRQGISGSEAGELPPVLRNSNFICLNSSSIDHEGWTPPQSQFPIGVNQNLFNTSKWVNYNSIVNSDMGGPVGMEWQPDNLDFHLYIQDIIRHNLAGLA